MLFSKFGNKMYSVKKCKKSTTWFILSRALFRLSYDLWCICHKGCVDVQCCSASSVTNGDQDPGVVLNKIAPPRSGLSWLQSNFVRLGIGLCCNLWSFFSLFLSFRPAKKDLKLKRNKGKLKQKQTFLWPTKKEDSNKQNRKKYWKQKGKSKAETTLF